MKAGDKESQERRRKKPQPQIYKRNLAVYTQIYCCASEMQGQHWRALLRSPGTQLAVRYPPWVPASTLRGAEPVPRALYTISTFYAPSKTT